MQDNEGHPPNDSELTQISAGLNQFHDIYAIHQTEAQKFLLFGRLCLEYLVQEELLKLLSIKSCQKVEGKCPLILILLIVKWYENIIY